MQTNRTLIFDFAGVIANNMAIKLQEAQRRFPMLGLKTERDVLRANLKPRIGAEAHEILGQAVGRRVLEYPVHANVGDVILRLKARNFRIVVLTMTKVATEDDIASYMRRHNLLFDAIHVVPNDADKVAWVGEEQSFGIIDDNQDVLMRFLEFPSYLFWANFSGDIVGPVHYRIRECISLLEFEEAVQQLDA